MAVLIRPKAWRLRPPNPQLNRGHNLAKELAFSIIPDGLGVPVDLVTGRKMTAFGPVMQAMTELGPALKFDGSSTAFSIPLDMSSTYRAQVSAWFYAESWPVSVIAELTANYNLNEGSFGLFGGDGGFGAWTGTNWLTADSHASSPSSLITADGCTEPSTGRLHHISAQYTRDLSDNTIWLDGVLQTMIRPGTTNNVAMSNNFANDTLYVGARGGSGAGTWLNGRLLALSVYRRALTKAESAQLYAEPFVFLQPQAPPQRYWTVGVKLGAQRRVRQQSSAQKPPISAQVDWGHSLAQGLVGAWLFNEQGGAKVQNLAGPLQGSLLNTYAWSPEGVEMSSDTGTINRTNLGDIRVIGDMTVLCSYTPLRVTGSADIGVIAKYNTGASPATNEWGLGGNVGASSGDARQWFAVGSGSTLAFATAAVGDVAVAGRRDVLAGTRRGTTLTLYRNGKVIGTNASGPSGAINTGTGRVIKLGEIDNGAGNNSNSRFHYAYLWNRALSQDEVQRLYSDPYAFLQPAPRWLPTVALDLPELSVVQNLRGWWKTDFATQSDNTAVTAWGDSSGNGYTGTAVGTPLLRTNQVNGRAAIQLQGAQYFAANGLAALFSGARKPMTVFCVCKPTSVSAVNDYFGFGHSTDNLPVIAASSNDATGKPSFTTRDDANHTASGTAGVAVAANDWHVFAYRDDLSTVSLYRDGAVDVAAISDSAVGTMTLDTFSIGALVRTTTGGQFVGMIAEELVYDRALTDAERITVERYLAAKYNLPAPLPRRVALYDQAVRRASVI